MFKKLQFSKWRQFEAVEIDFHKNLTILTGANGAGKTSILNLLVQHFSWMFQYVGTPSVNNNGEFAMVAEVPGQETDYNKQVSSNEITFGSFTYSDDTMSFLSIPSYGHLVYNVNILNMKAPFFGLNIPSHRPRFLFQHIDSFPTRAATGSDAYIHYIEARRSSIMNSNNGRENYHIKRTLLSLATLGKGNEYVATNTAAVNLYEGFQNILRKVLPKSLGFKKFSIRLPEVVLVTQTGDFAIDAVSGGITSIIDLAWQVYMYSTDHEAFSVCIDEPENHLHPQMQKDLLPSFLAAFPKVQFIVSTHSPFIISSVKDSSVYVLHYDENNKVVSSLLNNLDKSGSANDILTNALGLETTKPTWVDDTIDSIIEKYLSIGITSENLENFRQELKSIGFEKYLTPSVVELLERTRHHD